MLGYLNISMSTHMSSVSNISDKFPRGGGNMFEANPEPMWRGQPTVPVAQTWISGDRKDGLTMSSIIAAWEGMQYQHCNWEIRRTNVTGSVDKVTQSRSLITKTKKHSNKIIYWPRVWGSATVWRTLTMVQCPLWWPDTTVRRPGIPNGSGWTPLTAVPRVPKGLLCSHVLVLKGGDGITEGGEVDQVRLRMGQWFSRQLGGAARRIDNE
jgi:hypothetical protein